MITFNKFYFILFIILFVSEIIIALFVHDDIIRPYAGDFLVVIMLYSFVKSFVNLKPGQTAILVLVFSYLIEISQYIGIIHYLELDNSRLANTVLGNSFSWVDIMAYTSGAMLVIVAENLKRGCINKKMITSSEDNLWHFL